MASRAAGSIACAVLSLFVAAHARACWNEVGQKYGISPQLLYAIAKTESNFNSRAINRNRNGSYDVGLMQINSFWFPTLRKYGITEDLLYQPCVSIEVGAWILAQNIRHHGNSWNAVGAYNARDPLKRMVYAKRVYKNLPGVSGVASSAPSSKKKNQHRKG